MKNITSLKGVHPAYSELSVVNKFVTKIMFLFYAIGLHTQTERLHARICTQSDPQRRNEVVSTSLQRRLYVLGLTDFILSLRFNGVCPLGQIYTSKI